MTQIPDLSFEIDGDCIRLTQDAGLGEVESISLHRIHIAHIAHQMGLSIGDRGSPGLHPAKELASKLLTLRARIDHLANWLAFHSDSEHADLSYEQTYATATADIAEAFCLGLQVEALSSLGDVPQDVGSVGDRQSAARPSVPNPTTQPAHAAQGALL